MVLLFWFSGFYGPGNGSLSRSQALLYRPNFSIVNSWVELEGRFVMAEFCRRDSVIRVASVYAPDRNPEGDEFFTLTGLC